MDMLGITHVKHRQVGEFSKGMMRRVGLAQALINDPELVILDEPTSGLDPIGCREVKDIIQLMAQRGKTVILSSHLLADVEDVCDEIVVLYGGKIHAQGQVKELLKVQQKTRLEFPAVDEHVQNALLDVLKTHVSENEIALEKPHMRLEEFFLQVVEKAQSEKVETYGVQQPGAIADYLKGEPESDEQRILGALSESMSGEHAESKSDTAEEPEEEQAESTHVEEQLAALTGEKKSESDKNEPSEEQAEKDPEDKLRGIMDQQNHR
jgi:ABC-2 type transport system ATP-binding protein